MRRRTSVLRCRVCVASAAREGDDQRHFDDGDGDGEHERPERFTDPVSDHLRMMDGGEDRGGQQDTQQRQHGRRGLATPRRDQHESHQHRDHARPPQPSELVSHAHRGHYSAPVWTEDADRRSDPRTRTSTRRDLSPVEFGHELRDRRKRWHWRAAPRCGSTR